VPPWNRYRGAKSIETNFDPPTVPWVISLLPRYTYPKAQHPPSQPQLDTPNLPLQLLSTHQCYQTQHTHSLSTLHSFRFTIPESNHKVPGPKDTVSTKSTTSTSLAFVVSFLSSRIPGFLLVHALGRGLYVLNVIREYGLDRFAMLGHGTHGICSCLSALIGFWLYREGYWNWGMSQMQARIPVPEVLEDAGDCRVDLQRGWLGI